MPNINWKDYLKSSEKEAERAIAFFNATFDKKRYEYFIIHMHVAWNRLMISFAIKNEFDYFKNKTKNEIKPFLGLKAICKRKQLITNEKSKNLDILNAARNELMHNDTITNYEAKEYFSIFFQISNLFYESLKKIDPEFNLISNRIVLPSQNNNVVSREKSWFSKIVNSKDYKNLLQNTQNIKIKIENNENKDKEFINSDKETFPYEEAAKRIAKKIKDYKILDFVHMRRTFNFMGENNKAPKYNEIGKLKTNPKYGMVFVKTPVVTQKTIDIFIEICEKIKEYKSFLKKTYDEKTNLDIEEFITDKH